ncbi:hypothetical protein CL630_02870 [bacterium]|nr:hypothetical protein [bacterium]|tara:strand:- start:103 stop:297 length:195 start_codon:yes stop_codon:yes gene_type:complete
MSIVMAGLVIGMASGFIVAILASAFGFSWTHIIVLFFVFVSVFAVFVYGMFRLGMTLGKLHKKK